MHFRVSKTLVCETIDLTSAIVDGDARVLNRLQSPLARLSYSFMTRHLRGAAKIVFSLMGS